MKTKAFALFMLITLMGVTGSNAQETNRLIIPDLTALAGKTIALPLCVDNNSEIVAVEFDLQIPEGSSLMPESKVLTNRATDHEVVFRKKADNIYHGIIYSPTNNAILGRTGQLMSVNMQVSDAYEESSQHCFKLTNVVLASRNGNNVLTDVQTGVLTMQKGPDLTVVDVVPNATSYVPGTVATISWQVKNIGATATGAGWTEYLSLKNASGVKKLLSQTYYDENMAVDAVISRQIEVTLPAILGMDGEVLLEVEVQPYSGAGESQGLRWNNTGTTNVQVEKRLTLTLPTGSIAETYDSPVRCTLSRSGERTTAETFTITATEDSRLKIPASVTIPAGQSSVNFYIQLADNTLLDNNGIINVSVIGNGYPEVYGQVEIEDNEFPDLTVISSKNSVSEGETFQLTITAGRIPQEDLTVTIASEMYSRFTYPSKVTIPAGEKSVTFDVTVVDDDVPSLTLSNCFTAYAPAYNKGEVLIILEDDDVPILELMLTPNKVSEEDGPISIAAILRRTGVTNNKITVKLSDDSNGDIYYGTETIELAKGVGEAHFNLGTIDNAIVDGDRVVNITAAVYISSCSCNASGESAGVVAAQLTILDNDGPSLKLTSAASTLKEGGSTTLTISRNTTDTSSPLTITLSSDQDSRLSYDKSVTIPAGKSGITVNVTSLSNETQGDSFTAVFTATSDGFSSGTCFIMVTDQTLPDARVSITADKAKAEVGTEVTLTITISNEGNASLPAGTAITVYTAESTRKIRTLNALAVGETEERTITFRLPTSVGTARCYATVNDNNGVTELNIHNNTSSTLSIQAVAPFSTTIKVDKSIYSQGETVAITGRITGSSIANQTVEVYVVGDSYRKTLNVVTDADGAFSTTWISQAGQIGQYKVGARFPSEQTDGATTMFDILGYNVISGSNIQPTAGEIVTGKFNVYNPCGSDFTGVEVEVLSIPDNCDFDYNIGTTLQGRKTTYLNYSLKATTPSIGNEWQEIPMRLTTAEGISSNFTLKFFALSPIGQLNASTSFIQTTMQKDATRDYELTITNTGKGTTGAITLTLPSWMESATGTTLSALEYGQSTTVILRLTPTSDMQLNVPEIGNLAFSCENAHPKSIGFSITPVSTSEGTLVVDVTDEYTYSTSEAPHVAGSTIELRYPATNALVAEGITGEDGRYTINLTEGYYRLIVKSAGHDSYDDIIEISPEMVTKKTINLSVQTITSSFDIKETEVEDEYEIVTTLNIETNVPVPVVQLTVPNKLEVDQLAIGESLIFHAILTNKGLIAAKDAALLLPEGFKHITFEPLAEYSGLTIAPQQSVTIPVKVTRVSRPSQASSKKQYRAKSIDDDPCVGQPGTLYFWDCGTDRKWHRYSIPMQMGSCKSNDPSTWNPSYNPTTDKEWTGGWPEGTRISSSPTLPSFGSYVSSSSHSNLMSSTEDKGCEPCQNAFLIDLLKCTAELIPQVKYVINGIEFVKDAADFIQDGAKCMESYQSDADLVKKLSECPFTDEFAKPVQIMQSLFKLLNGIAQGDYFGADLSEEEKELLIQEFDSAWDDLMEKLKEEAADKAIDFIEEEYPSVMHAYNKYPSVMRVYNKYPSVMRAYNKMMEVKDKVSGIIEKGNNIKDKADQLSETDKAQIGDVLKSTCELTEAIADMLEETGILKELGGQMKGVTGKLKKYVCLLDLINYECDKEGRKTSVRRIKGITNSAIQSYVEAATRLVSLYEADDNIKREIFGDDVWLEVPLSQFIPLYYYLTNNNNLTFSELRYILKPQNVTYEQFDAFIERWLLLFNSNNDYEEINIDYIKEQLEQIDESISYLENTGYTHFRSLLSDRYNKVMNESGSNSVCSSITLQFKQNMAMTRQAFEGTLTVFNGHETEAMTNTKLTLVVTSEDGDIATEREFDIKLKSLDGFDYVGEPNLTQGWSLDANATGTATILFTPSKYAAPTEPKKYSFGGTLTYTDPYNGLDVTRILTPITLTVKPTADLVLTYFMQRDIYGDDPLTLDAVEPSVPAEFALLINNIGYGDANDVRMQTQQPEIVANEKGLDIDFHLISSQLNGGQVSPVIGSFVATQFGNIPALSTTYAQWWFESSLLGHFTDYDVTVKPISYTNPDMSLINLEKTSIKELIRSIKIADGDIPLVGFLVNEELDVDDTPDRLYLSNGETAEVVTCTSTTWRKVDDTNYEVTIKPSAEGWNYGCIVDPTHGYSTLVSVKRISDGKIISLRNFWQTDRTLIDGKDWLYNNNLHFIDEFGGSAQSYVLTFEPTPEKILEVTSIDGIPIENEVAKEPVDVVIVNFSKIIDPTTFTADDITLNVQSEKQDASLIGISSEDNKSFRLDLSAVNAQSSNGYYTLSVQTSGITDVDGFTGKTGKTAGWVFYQGGLVQLVTGVWPAESGNVQRVTEIESRGLKAPSSDNDNIDSALYGSLVTLRANPANGFNFSKWILNGQEVSTEQEYTARAISDLDIIANFDRKYVPVTIVKDIDGGSMSYELKDPDTGSSSNVGAEGKGMYKYGTEFVFTAIPHEGYLFEGWNVNGEAKGTDKQLSLKVAKETIVKAMFTPTYKLGDANGDGNVSIADVTAIINRINGVENSNFNAKAADVNGDGAISIADVTGVINIINKND